MSINKNNFSIYILKNVSKKAKNINNYISKIGILNNITTDTKIIVRKFTKLYIKYIALYIRSVSVKILTIYLVIINIVALIFSILTSPTPIEIFFFPVLIMIPIILYRSASWYSMNDRMITANFFSILSISWSSFLLLIIIYGSPMQYWFGGQSDTKSIYSLFDILTFIGTFATLTLVWAGVLIPQEERLLQSNLDKSIEIVDVFESYIKEIDGYLSGTYDSEEKHDIALRIDRLQNRLETIPKTTTRSQSLLLTTNNFSEVLSKIRVCMRIDDTIQGVGSPDLELPNRKEIRMHVKGARRLLIKISTDINPTTNPQMTL